MSSAALHQVNNKISDTVELWVGQPGEDRPQALAGHAPQLHHPQLLPTQAHHPLPAHQLRAGVLGGARSAGIRVKFLATSEEKINRVLTDPW